MKAILPLLFFLILNFDSGLLQEECSLNVYCLSGKCCGPYDDMGDVYTCCSTMSFCGEFICVGYWVVIVPCVAVGVAIIAGIIIIMMQRKRRTRNRLLMQQNQYNQQQQEQVVNQPQVYYVQQQAVNPQYYQGQPIYNQDQGYQQQNVG